MTESGVIQRDLLKLLPFLNTLECKQPPTRILTLAFAIASIAYVEGLKPETTKRLIDLAIDGFETGMTPTGCGQNEELR